MIWIKLIGIIRSMSKGESSPIPALTKEVIGNICPAVVMVEASDPDPRKKETHFATGVNIDPRGLILTFGSVLGLNRDRDRQLRRIVKIHSDSGIFITDNFYQDSRINIGIIRLEGVHNLPTVKPSDKGLDSQGEDVFLIGRESVRERIPFEFWHSFGRGVSDPRVNYFEFGLFPCGVNPTDLCGFNLTDSLERMHLAVPSFRGAPLFDLNGGLQGIYVGYGFNLTDNPVNPFEVQHIAVSSLAILRHLQNVHQPISNLPG